MHAFESQALRLTCKWICTCFSESVQAQRFYMLLRYYNYSNQLVRLKPLGSRYDSGKVSKVKSDHRSKFSNLSNWKEEAWKKKNQGFNGIRTRDLSDTGAMLCTNWAMNTHIRSAVSCSLVFNLSFNSLPCIILYIYSPVYKLHSNVLMIWKLGKQ